MSKDKNYSATPLHKKLGIKSGTKLGVVNEPDHFWGLIEPLPDGVDVYERASVPLDVIVYFSDSHSSIQRRVPVFARYIVDDGALWVCYPKKTSKIETDLTFERVQDVGLGAGLVDNKSCAVDDDWSAVRFVYRLKDRRGK